MRQLAIALEWIKLDYNIPSRDNYYTAQVSQAVRQVLHRKPETVTLDGQIIPFIEKKPAPKPVVDDQEREVIPILTKEDIERMQSRMAHARIKALSAKPKE